MSILKDFAAWCMERANPTVTSIDGGTYTDKPLTRVRTLRDRVGKPLELHTLSSLVDYITRNIDGFLGGERQLALHVESPTSVLLFDGLDPVERNRETFARATFTADAFPFGRYLDQVELVTRLLTQFVDTEALKGLVGVVGTMREEATITSDDDGWTQKVAAAHQLKLGETKLPNPLVLRPFRTFPELEQPSGLYLVRARGGAKPDPKNHVDGELPTVALFAVENGQWQLEAEAAIRDYLRSAISEAALADKVAVLA